MDNYSERILLSKPFIRFIQWSTERRADPSFLAGVISVYPAYRTAVTKHDCILHCQTLYCGNNFATPPVFLFFPVYFAPTTFPQRSLKSIDYPFEYLYRLLKRLTITENADVWRCWSKLVSLRKIGKVGRGGKLHETVCLYLGIHLGTHENIVNFSYVIFSSGEGKFVDFDLKFLCFFFVSRAGKSGFFFLVRLYLFAIFI